MHVANTSTRNGRAAVLKRTIFVVFFCSKSPRRDKRQDHIISDFCSVVADRAGRQAEAEVQKTGGKKSIVRQSYNWHNELAAKAAASAAAAAAWQAAAERRRNFCSIFQAADAKSLMRATDGRTMVLQALLFKKTVS